MSLLVMLESLPLAGILYASTGERRLRWTSVVVLVVLLCAAVSVEAQVHKCVNAAGRVEYREAPCGNDAKGGAINAQANVSDGGAVERARLRAENDMLREQLQRREDDRAAAVNEERGRTAAGAQQRRNCEVATRDYQVIASSISAKKAEVAARRSAMHIACGTLEPPTTEVTIIKQPAPIQRECFDSRDWNCVQTLPRR